jgi:multiple sugar transport system permease protein
VTRRRPGGVAAFALMVAVSAAILLPFYLILVFALQTHADLGLSGLVPKPSNLTLHNFADANTSMHLLSSLANSAIVSFGAVAVTLAAGLPAGYALALLDFRGRGAVFATLMTIMTVPFILLFIPLYGVIVKTFDLGDTYVGMILPYAVNPVAVFLFRQFFRGVPASLFEAARIDGASELRILRSIAIPLARPAILAATLITFIVPYNDFLWPFLANKNPDLQPLSIALANFISNSRYTAIDNPFATSLVGALVLVVPVVVLLVAFRRHFLQVSLTGALKD